MTQQLAIASPVGPLTLEAADGFLTAIRFGGTTGTTGIAGTTGAPGMAGMSRAGIFGMSEMPGMPGTLGTLGMSGILETLGMPGILETPGVPGLLDPAGPAAAPAEAARNDDTPPLLQEAACQLAAYFAGKLRRFELPLRPAGTPFQQRVWAALCEIPYGEVRSYGAIAARIGSPKAARAVGRANHGNPLPIVIPCHRVIGASGALTGYGGGLPIKEYLLRIEGYRLR